MAVLVDVAGQALQLFYPEQAVKEDVSPSTNCLRGVCIVVTSESCARDIEILVQSSGKATIDTWAN